MRTTTLLSRVGKLVCWPASDDATVLQVNVAGASSASAEGSSIASARFDTVRDVQQVPVAFMHA